MPARVKGTEPFPNRLKITARPTIGFWRAGKHHPAEAVEHDGGTFTVAQAEQLAGEPQLVVEDLGPDASVA